MIKFANQIKLNIEHSYDDLLSKAAKILHIKVSDINKDKFKILRKSIDARDKSNIMYVYNVAVDYEDDNKFCPIINGTSDLKEKGIRPIIVGFGPAGLFASYVFAVNGLRPIIIERGKSLDDRKKDVDKFFKTLELDENSNVSFGEGGAGAFSDGKLNTNNKDKTGVYKFVLETFVKFGADAKILYENLPHIGTDKLTDIIKNMRDEIVRLGGEVRYSTKFTYDEYKKYADDGTPIILAIGNSSRDTFRDLIKNGFDIKSKAFAVGFRVAHKQKIINEAQYGKMSEFLPPANYKLTYDAKNGHSVYSFCMCPGGYIINSSNYKGYLAINGMSYNDRAGIFANSAIVETIKPEELLEANVAENLNNVNNISPLIGIEFQEKVEKMAHDLDGGYIPYYVANQKDSNFANGENLENAVFKGLAKYDDSIINIYEKCGLNFSIKNDVLSALKHFNKIIHGFYDNVLIAGVETRTSSPVSLERDDNYMCKKSRFYPCGEGLGHGGGILSSATDGVNVAFSIIKNA